MTDETQNKKSFSAFRTILGSFNLFIDNFTQFLIVGSVFSVIMMILNFVSGQSFLCLNENLKDYAICKINVFVYIVAMLLLWFIICMYMRIWSRTAILKRSNFSFKMLKPIIDDLKIYGVIFAFLLSIFVALGAGFLLFIRVPNPDWKIEIMYFSVVSVGFFVPFFATPILSYIGFVAEGKKLPSIKELWQNVKGNITLLFISFFSVGVFSFLAANIPLRYFLQMGYSENIFIVVIAEFFYNIIIMFLATIFMNYCYSQKKFLFERE